MDIMLTEWTKEQIVTEFSGYKPEMGFSGGCRKSKCPRFCVHLKNDGSIGSVAENCKYYDTCSGFESKYRV